MRTSLVFVALLSLALALPAFGAGDKTYKNTFPVPCSKLWDAVKLALSNPDNYKDVASDEDKMTAEYNVKHSIHWSVTGAVNQGKNRVSLAPIGTACEMSVVSMYSGFVAAFYPFIYRGRDWRSSATWTGGRRRAPAP